MQIFRKSGLSWILTLLFFLNSTSLAFADELQINGKGAALIDSKSGQILYGKNENTPLPPASTTKIITAYLALERSKPSDIVKVGKNPTLCEPSSIGLKEGETMSLENLLYAMLIKSANDAAVAIAEYISGTVPEFAKLMNAKAREWGATNTNFVNPNGWPNPNHYTTAHDLALIAKHVMENSFIRKIVATKYKEIPRSDDKAVKWLPNHNKMLWRYEGANGVKTGYTKEAKQCLVASAARGDQEFIAVVLGSQGSNVWTDATKLLDYGFNNFNTFKYKNANQLVKQVSVKNGVSDVGLVTQKDFYYTLKKGESTNVTEKIEINQNTTAPVKKGQVLGRLKFYNNGAELGFVNLVAQADVQKSVFAQTDYNNFPLNPLVAGAAFLSLFVVWNIIKSKKRRLGRRKRNWYNSSGIR